MNKYLTKIAEISTLTLQKVHGDSSAAVRNTNAVTSPASLGKIIGREILLETPIFGGVVAGGLLANKAYNLLTKKAFEFKNQHTKDVVDTGVIAGLGGVGNMVSNRILGHKEAFNPKSFAVGAGIGLVADYAGLKINKALGGVKQKKETNVPL